uniref:Uncharacterized protein n=1 Tax=viral metagenome TaxID=1070528 RepID=A0A6C0K8Y7_9ZZZZ
MTPTDAVTKVFMAIGIIASLCYIVYLSPIFSPEKWTRKEDIPGKDRAGKSAQNIDDRGTFVSALSAFLGVIVVYLLSSTALKGNETVTMNAILLWWGFILGPIIGYLLDVGIGSEDGLRRLGTWKGIRYTFSKLPTFDFWRYCVTVLLDIFVSTPIMDGIKVLYSASAFKKALSPLLSSQMPGVLQSIVQFITFKAYTNQTRFQWAYPDSKGDRDLRWEGKLVALATAVSAASYVGYSFHGASGTAIENAVSSPLGERVTYACAAVLSLTLLDMAGEFNAYHTDDEDEVRTDQTEGTQAAFGFVLFAAITGLSAYMVHSAARGKK